MLVTLQIEIKTKKQQKTQKQKNMEAAHKKIHSQHKSRHKQIVKIQIVYIYIKKNSRVVLLTIAISKGAVWKVRHLHLG